MQKFEQQSTVKAFHPTASLRDAAQVPLSPPIFWEVSQSVTSFTNVCFLGLSSPASRTFWTLSDGSLNCFSVLPGLWPHQPRPDKSKPSRGHITVQLIPCLGHGGRAIQRAPRSARWSEWQLRRTNKPRDLMYSTRAVGENTVFILEICWENKF